MMQNTIESFCLGIVLYLLPITVTSAGLTEYSYNKKELIIATYNVRNCMGMDNLTDYKRVADIISRIDPQIIAIQELDSATQRSNGAVVLNELATRTDRYAEYSASIDFQGGKYGVGILSKEQPLSRRSISLPGREEKRSILIVEFKDYIFCCTHFSLNEEDRLKSAEIINSLFKDSPKPVFLAGDFNAVPESEVVKTLLEKWELLNNPSLPTIPSVNPSRCIDFIFRLKTELPEVAVEESTVEEEPVASDHLPVWIKLQMNIE